MHLAMVRAEAPRFARRIAAAALRAVAAIAILVIAIVYALGAAHAALAGEIGPVWASVALAVGLAFVALMLFLVAGRTVKQARTDLAEAAAYDFEEVRRRSLRFVRAAGRFVGLRWIPIALRTVRAAPWRLALGLALVAGAVFLLWPYLRREWKGRASRRDAAAPPA